MSNMGKILIKSHNMASMVFTLLGERVSPDITAGIYLRRKVVLPRSDTNTTNISRDGTPYGTYLDLLHKNTECHV
jgi:hypothetical protein